MARDFRLRQAQHAFDGGQRQRVELLARAHDQRVADGERERQANGERGALARRCVSMWSAPPSRLISVATTSMPTPRPACCVIVPAVEKPGSRMSCIASSSLSVWPSGIRPSAAPLSRIALRFMPAPSSVRRTMTSAPSRCSSSLMRPVSDLPCGRALVRPLDAVDHGVTQHVLERRQHALEHLAIELARGALDDQLGALAGVGRGLAHDARETLHVTLERNHARAHEPVLQFGDRAGLLLQEVLRVLREGVEQAPGCSRRRSRFRRARVRTAGSRSSGRAPADRSRCGGSRRPLPRGDGGSALRSRSRACAAAPSGA